MSEAIDDMEAYMKMNGYSIVFQILHSTEPGLERSRQLLQKIQKRALYKFIRQTQLKRDEIQTEDPSQRSLADMRKSEIKANVLNQLEPSTLKEQLENDVVVEVSQLLPEKVQEEQIRIYAKTADEKKVKCLKTTMRKWCTDNDYPAPIRM